MLFGDLGKITADSWFWLLIGPEGAANCQTTESLPSTVALALQSVRGHPGLRPVRNVTHPIPLGNSTGVHTQPTAPSGEWRECLEMRQAGGHRAG